MVEITYQMVLSTLQTAGILVGIVYYFTIMRNQQRTRELTLKAQELTLETRQAQLFTQLMDKYTTKEGLENQRVVRGATWSSYEEWLELRRDEKYYEAYLWLANIYDGMGALVREDLLNVRMVALVGATYIIDDWEKYEDVIYEMRKRRNDRRFRGKWEYLYITIMKYLEEHPELVP